MEQNEGIFTAFGKRSYPERLIKEEEGSNILCLFKSYVKIC